MSEDKNKKPIKFKTFDEIKNDSIYEISLFSKKRQSQTKLSTTNKINDEDNIENPVRINTNPTKT